MSIIIAILIFGLIVVIHEFGHFIVARKNGIFVEEFAIGMGPAIFKTRKYETVYSLRILPIGGYCKMLGEDGSSEDSRAFNNKGVLARISVVVAGAFMNFVLAFVAFFIVASLFGISLPVVGLVMPDTPAQRAGLQLGDRVLKVNDTSIHIYEDLDFELTEGRGEPILLTIKRGTEVLTLDITPELIVDSGVESYRMGFQCEAKAGYFDEGAEGLEKATFLENLSSGFYRMLFYIKITAIGATRLFTLKVQMDEMAGAIGIVGMIGTAYETTIELSVWHTVRIMLTFVGLLSANIGFFNLLPLPALDGGRLIFLIAEGIRRKPVDPEKEGMVHFAGFVLLMILAVVIAYNDIIKML